MGVNKQDLNITSNHFAVFYICVVKYMWCHIYNFFDLLMKKIQVTNEMHANIFYNNERFVQYCIYKEQNYCD